VAHTQAPGAGRRGVRWFAAAAVSAALVASACSSSGNKTSAGSTTGAGNGGATATSAGSAGSSGSGSGSGSGDIVVGGVQDGNYEGIDTAFNARIARFNKEGGVDGHKVKFIGVIKDGSSLSNNAQAVQKLVLSDKVFAVAPFSSQAWSPASAQLLNQHNVPYIGWAIGGPAACQGQAAFPVTGCQSAGSYYPTTVFTQIAQTENLGSVNNVKIAIIGLDNAGAKSGVALVAGGAKAAGADVVYSQATIPQAGATDYSPYAQALVAAKPNVIYLAVTVDVSAALIAAVRQAGYTGVILNPVAYLPGILSSQKQLAAAWQGTYAVSFFPTQEEGAPVAQQMLADLKAAGASPNLTLATSVGWFAADQFVQELQATAKAGPLTSENFVKTIHAGFTYTSLPGGLTDITFPLRQSQPSSCTALMKINPDGTYTTAAKYACDPKAVVKVG
jgi:ABC-type branched-subunit amino acid transport system substrate-binding protein